MSDNNFDIDKPPISPRFAEDEPSDKTITDEASIAHQESQLSTKIPQRTNPDETHIAIWGTTQAGKTTYLATLYRVFVSPDKPRNWDMMTTDNIAERWISQIYARLAYYGIFPDATPPKTIHYPCFAFSAPDTDQKLFELTFVDAPGEIFRRIVEYPEVLNYLRGCDGLIILIDSTLANKGGPDFDFEAVTQTLRALTLDANNKFVGQLDIPIAFLLTKCDKPGLREAKDDPVGFSNKTFGPLLYGQVHSICKNFKWYGTSALGFETNRPPNTYIRWNGSIGIRYPRNVNPINVAEPLIWLIEQIQRKKNNKENIK